MRTPAEQLFKELDGDDEAAQRARERQEEFLTDRDVFLSDASDVLLGDTEADCLVLQNLLRQWDELNQEQDTRNTPEMAILCGAIGMKITQYMTAYHATEPNQCKN